MVIPVNLPVQYVLFVGELVIAKGAACRIQFIAGIDETYLMVQRHGQLILSHELLDFVKCLLLLTHIHGGVGSCNHLIQPFLFGNRRVIGCGRCKTIIELALGKGCHCRIG